MPRTVFSFALILSLLGSFSYASPVNDFFYRHEAVRIVDASSDNSSLAVSVAAKVEEYGISSKNLAAHGFKTNGKFVALKANTIFPVVYFDVKVYPAESGSEFAFDLIYSRGSDFIEEAPAHSITGCKARFDIHGGIQLAMNECIANSDAQ